MKAKSIISMLAIGACALAVQQAQATVTETFSNNGLTVDSSVTLSGGLYDYTYQVTVPNIAAFTVNGNPPPMDVAGITSINAPAGWNTGSAVTGTHVTWTSVTGGDVSGDVTFSFWSPLPPIQGQAYAQDDTQYGPVEVYVPGAVPDGSLTMGLLGASFLGLGAVRRKFGC